MTQCVAKEMNPVGNHACYELRVGDSVGVFYLKPQDERVMDFAIQSAFYEMAGYQGGPKH